MDDNNAVIAFSALAQETRLSVLRFLIRLGEQGCLSGNIGESLNIRQNTMSTNLGILKQAGLVNAKREGRSIRYFANFAKISDLLGFLMEDCCGGSPKICQPIIAKVACAPT